MNQCFNLFWKFFEKLIFFQSEINTGITDPSQLLQVIKWEKMPTLKYWKNDKNGKISSCNKIKGSDASGYPPFRQKGDSMYIMHFWPIIPKFLR